MGSSVVLMGRLLLEEIMVALCLSSFGLGPSANLLSLVLYISAS